LAGSEVTPRSDVFALGLVMYELFTGKRALEAKTIAELIQKHDDGNLLPPSAVVSCLVRRCSISSLGSSSFPSSSW
jgi:hypothetical protein